MTDVGDSPLAVIGGSAIYTIETDCAHRLVRLRLAGILSVGEVAAIAADEQLAVEEMAGDTHRLLIEATGATFRDEAVVHAFRAFIANAPRKAARIAIVVEDAPAAAQVRLIADAARASIFLDTADAERWLSEPDA